MIKARAVLALTSGVRENAAVRERPVLLSQKNKKNKMNDIGMTPPENDEQEKEGKTRRVKLDYPFGKTRPEPGDVMEVAPGVMWVSMPLPFSLKWINLWLIDDGDSWTMVDTGLNTKDTRNHWEEVFATHLGGKPIDRVIITHMHPDHVGLAGWVSQRWGCEIWMSRLEYITCRMLVADTGREAPQVGVDFFHSAGWGEEALQTYRERFGGFGRAVSQLPDAYRRLSGGMEIEIGGRQWRVLEGSGHSPEHACLFCPELNVLISGDQLLPRISSNVSVHATEPEADPLTDWLQSCQKLIDETPADVFVLPSHNEPFHGAHHRLQALIDGHERALDRLAEKLETPHRAVECFSTLFGRKIGVGDMYSATGEAVAHLNCLMQRNLAVRERSEDGVHFYKRA